MRDWIIGQGVILYVFAGCLMVGALSAFIANHGYKRLIKESELMGNTGNRLLKYIKLKFGSYYKLNMRPQDTRALTKHYMYKYKIGFMNVMSWIKLSKLAVGVIGISAVGCLLWMQDQGKTMAQIVSMVGCAVICAGFVYILHRLYDFPEKQNMLEWYLMDYLENFLKNKIESAQGTGADSARNGQNSGVKRQNGSRAKEAEGFRPKETPELGAAAAKVLGEQNFPDTDGEIFNNNSGERTAWSPKGNNNNEVAASKISAASCKKPEEKLFAGKRGEDCEDEIDARIVEDILREFLN